MAGFDLDAVQNEATGDPHPFTFAGEDLLIPRTSDWPAEAMEHVTEGRVTSAFRLVMGDDDYDRFAAHKPKLAVYEAIFDEIAKREGLGDAGNSSGSSKSSRSTRQRSKPTSRVTTTSA